MMIFWDMLVVTLLSTQMNNKEIPAGMRIGMKIMCGLVLISYLFMTWFALALAFTFGTQGNVTAADYIWITLLSITATAAIYLVPWGLIKLFKVWYKYEKEVNHD